MPDIGRFGKNLTGFFLADHPRLPILTNLAGQPGSPAVAGSRNKPGMNQAAYRAYRI
jgi:hypothetical protein